MSEIELKKIRVKAVLAKAFLDLDAALTKPNVPIEEKMDTLTPPGVMPELDKVAKKIFEILEVE